MADLVMGAMGSLVPKLGELLKEEYNLQTGVKERIRILTLELEGAQAALRKVAQVPLDQLDDQVKLWAREVRESSYDMEDILDTFLVRFQGCDSAKQESSLRRLGEKMANLFKKSKEGRKISLGVKDIMIQLDEVTKRCCRYKVDDIVARPATTSTVDPRLAAMYNKVKDLVGIDESSGELISMLQTQQQGDMLNPKMRIVSVYGVGGLGKTTLAKAVYDKVTGDFNCRAFVPVGRNPNMKKVIQEILIELDKKRYMQFNFGLLNEIYQFINELRDFLRGNKRYFIVIDDIWEVQSWETIKLAFDDDDSCGGRIIVTTRKLEVATKAGEVYKLQPLPDHSSRELFYARMSGNEGNHVDNKPDEISGKILKKCGGIPLAIITMASLLVGKPRDKWFEIYQTIGFGRKDDKEAENTTMRILSFSYYDMPSYLRTCLLYLSAFLEDSVIPKGPLIWKWVAEGFVHEEQGTWLFETGEGYFNDLINRSLIQGVEGGHYDDGVIIGCRVHDIVLDFIRFMSHEGNFFTILDNDQDTPLQSHVRRLAHHNWTTWRTHEANHFNGMRTVRSFSAQGCAVDSWVPLSSFTLLRVLAIENCNLTDDCRIRIEHVGHLHHLRYLSLSGTRIHRVPEEIGALTFLQTLDLWDSRIVEAPSSSSLPTKLVCLRITFDHKATAADTRVAWVERLTSLEELSIDSRFCEELDSRFQCKELGSLKELRVLTAHISLDDEESERYFVESLSHLNKLQHLTIAGYRDRVIWQAAGIALPRQLRHFSIYDVRFSKMPPCINASCLPYLCHLDFFLQNMDEQDLKNLGGLPELRFLKLELWSSRLSAIISNINDNNAGYFPKLRCCKLPRSMVLFFVNKKDKSVSFELDDGYRHFGRPRYIEGAAAEAPRCFMPSLQELHFTVGIGDREHPRYCDYLGWGWEYLSSLREIVVDIVGQEDFVKVVKEKLRRAADAHPNRPALHFVAR